MHYKRNKTGAISFPLGGIGCGSIALRGNGALTEPAFCDRPAKNERRGFTHFAIKAEKGGERTVRILQGDAAAPCSVGHRAPICDGFSPDADSMAGFPHFGSVDFIGEFPIATLQYRDATFPGDVRLVAFNPLIPHREDDSSLPAAFFEWEIENTEDTPVTYTLAFTVTSPAERSVNTAFCERGHTGIVLQNAGAEDGSRAPLDLTLATDAEGAVAEEYWYRGAPTDGVTTYWRNLSAEGAMPARHYEEAGTGDSATLAATVTLPAWESTRVRFVLAWYAPVAENGRCDLGDGQGRPRAFRGGGATLFPSSREVAAYALGRFTSLLADTRLFVDAITNSSLSAPMRDAVSAGLAALSSPAVFRGEGGLLGSYAVSFLFPRLARSLCEVRGEHETPHAPLDGWMGEVIACYREWKLSGDTAYLRARAADILRMSEYAFSEENPDGWDRDGDGILEGRQHHTRGTALFGPSPWLQGLYLLALSAGAEIAEAVGEEGRAAHYRALYRRGREFLNTELYNGRYFIQRIDLTDRALLARYGAEDRCFNTETGEIKHQIGEGSATHQMLADLHAAVLGLPPCFDEEKRDRALGAIMCENYRPRIGDIANMGRVFSYGDEAGAVVCSYPEGSRVPTLPLPGSEETVPGLEYALAGLLLASGRDRDSEEIVWSVRDRYDGAKRNPWGERGCGGGDACPMASFLLMPLSAGMTFDMTVGYLGFRPHSDPGRYLVSIGNTWGEVFFAKKGCRLLLLGEPLTLSAFSLPYAVRAVMANGVRIPAEMRDGRLTFPPTAAREWIFLRADA